MKKKLLWSIILPFLSAVPLVIILIAEEWITVNFGYALFNTLLTIGIILCILLFMFPFFLIFRQLFSTGGYNVFWGRGKVAQQILLTGKDAVATVLSIGESSMGGTITINEQPVLNLVMSIKQANISPYEVSMDILIPRASVSQFQPGAAFPVKVDMNNPNIVVLDLKRLETMQKPSFFGKTWSAMDRELTEKSGIQVMVDIIGIEDTGKSEDFKPVIRMIYDVHKPGDTVYRLEKELSVQSEIIAKLRSIVGKSFRGKVHPYDREKVTFEIDF